tara:strand:- start:94 stop:291 length:198 start_codon:yes stop_codon:yes gene_type:complete
MFNVIKKLLKNIKSDKPLKYSLYVNKNGITLIQNKYYSGVSHYELYGTQKPKYNSKQWCDSYDFS